MMSPSRRTVDTHKPEQSRGPGAGELTGRAHAVWTNRDRQLLRYRVQTTGRARSDLTTNQGIEDVGTLPRLAGIMGSARRRFGILAFLALPILFIFPGSAAASSGHTVMVHEQASGSIRIASAAAPQLTLANIGVSPVNAQFSDTFPGYSVSLNSGCANSDTLVCLTIPGLGAFQITTTTSNPFRSGQVYPQAAMTVTAGGQTCGEFQGYAGYTAVAVVDQFTYSQGVTGFAVQFSCANAKVQIGGSIAYRMTNSTAGQGYYMYDSSGDTFNFGNNGYLSYLGNPGFINLNQPVVGMATTPDKAGYWMTAADGGVFTFGDARFYGSTGNVRLNKPIVGMAATADGRGYWFVASDGGVFTFGDARFYGSTGNVRLNKPIVGMIATADGRGYWLVASDGGVFTFGDARFYGSTGNVRLNKPIVGMAATPDGRGYWMVATDGGIFTFGDARFFGSTGNVHLAQPITGMLPTSDDRGYWLVASDGGMFTFGDATFHGSLGGLGFNSIIGMVR
jgi:hypothetical protein